MVLLPIPPLPKKKHAPSGIHGQGDLAGELQVKELAPDRHVQLVKRVLQDVIGIQAVYPGFPDKEKQTNSSVGLGKERRKAKRHQKSTHRFKNLSTPWLLHSATAKNFIPVGVWKLCKSKVSASSSSMPLQPGTGDSWDDIA